MELQRSGREFYTLQIAATDIAGAAIPDAGPYEASFDGDATWHAGTQDVPTGFWQWLVAGPEAPDPPVGVIVLAVVTAENTYPIVRLVDDPEVIVREAPAIVMT